MLPALNPKKGLMLRAGSLERAPWFEIWLFKTRLRFRNPKATAKLPTTILAEPTDLRPFLNTRSKQAYWNCEGLARGVDIYSSRWSFSARRWFAKPSAMLDFHLSAVEVKETDKAQYPDLYQAATGAEWVAHYYLSRMAFRSQFTFTKLDSGDIEVEIDDKLIGVQTATDKKRFTVETLQINGHIAYRIAPAANQLDFLIPFTPTDVVTFTFVLTSTEDLPEAVRQPVMQQASKWANEIVQTLCLEYPDKL